MRQRQLHSHLASTFQYEHATRHGARDEYLPISPATAPAQVEEVERRLTPVVPKAMHRTIVTSQLSSASRIVAISLHFYRSRWRSSGICCMCVALWRQPSWCYRRAAQREDHRRQRTPSTSSRTYIRRDLMIRLQASSVHVVTSHMRDWGFPVGNATPGCLPTTRVHWRIIQVQ